MASLEESLYIVHLKLLPSKQLSMSLSKLSVFQRLLALLSIISIGSILIRFSEEDIPTYHHIGVLEYSVRPTMSMGNSINTSNESKLTRITATRIPLRKIPRFRPKTKCRTPHGKMLSTYYDICMVTTMYGYNSLYRFH